MSGECRECGHIAPDHRDDCPVTGMYNAAVDALSSILGMTFIPYRSPAPSSSLPMPSKAVCNCHSGGCGCEGACPLHGEGSNETPPKLSSDSSSADWNLHERCEHCGEGHMANCPKHEAADGSSEEPAPITHVAIRWRGQVWSLPRPYRHHHIIQVIAFLTTSAEREDGVDCSESRGDQGFLDATGKYLDRRTALGVALENDQVLDRSDIRAGMLFSEDLW